MAINNFNEALTQFSPYVPKIKLQGAYTLSQVVTLPANIQYVFALVVGGGGGGSAAQGSDTIGAGGGAGGINWGLFPVFGSTSINVIVGAGGTGATYSGASVNYGGKGGDSSADAIYAGGGAGGYFGINSPTNGLYTQSWWGGGVKSTGYELTGSQFWNDIPMQWGFPNAISGISGTGLGSMFWHTTTGFIAGAANYDYFPANTGAVIAAAFTPLVGNGGGTAGPGAGVSSVYFSGGTGASAGGGGAGWTGNGSNSSGSTGGAGGTGGGGGGAGGSATNGANGGAGYVELYW